MCRLQEANKAVVEERERSHRNDQQLSDYEAEIGLLRRRVETLETDREKDKKTIAHLQDALNRARVVCLSVCLPVCHSSVSHTSSEYVRHCHIFPLGMQPHT